MSIIIDDLNEQVLAAQYAVRGPIVARAVELEKKGREIIFCNIGNPQALGQKPFTYLGQFLTLLRWPSILTNARITGAYPKDLLKRAIEIIKNNPNLVGRYSASPGVQFIREAVSKFTEFKVESQDLPGNLTVENKLELLASLDFLVPDNPDNNQKRHIEERIILKKPHLELESYIQYWNVLEKYDMV